jgi:serine protease SohB
MEYLANYGIFLAETATLVIAILLAIGGIIAIAQRNKEKEQGKILVTELNEKYEDLANSIQEACTHKSQLKAEKKARKAEKKQLKKKPHGKEKSRIFVVNFQGDLRASEVGNLAEEISAILIAAKPKDQVLVRLESGGGIVNAYGLAASQLQRLRHAKIPVIVAIDKIAASGGYMMACVADKIIAAPFSIIGSIGVVAQLPNFNRLLKKNDIDFEQITAGQYKRTLTLFGENTEKGREKMQQEVNEMHELFKTFIKIHREQVDIEQVSTGEHWFATQAIHLKLVDDLKTSDDYLIEALNTHYIYEIQYKVKKPLTKRISVGFQSVLKELGYYG